MVIAIIPNTSFMTLVLREAYPITEFQKIILLIIQLFDTVIKLKLELPRYGSNTKITDGYGFFSSQDIDNYVIITYPASVAGTYQITEVSADHLSATINASLPAFANGIIKF
jgi:hypothetical protein